MSVQIPLFEKTDSIPSKTTARIENIRFEPKQFDENFEVLADEVGLAGLRKVVLEFATRGTLVPRTSDTTGTELLNDIAAHRLGIQSDSTNADTLRIANLPAPHAIPDHWCWASLEVLTHPVRRISYGILMPGPEHPGGPLYVKVRNMKNGVIDVASLPRTTPEIYAKYSRSALARGDLLVSIRGSFGGVALVPDEIEGANITQDSARIAPLAGVDRRYLLVVLRSPICQRYFASVAKGAAVQGINIGDLRRTPIPLPPVEEQKRIVAKVDELMRLIDDLEAKQMKKREVQSRLRTAALDALTSADHPKEFEIAWTRVAATFEVLFEKAEAVDELRQAILWLATHGALTEGTGQDGHRLLEQARKRRRRDWEISRLAEFSAGGTTPTSDAWKAKYKPGVVVERSDWLVAGIPARWAVASLEEVAEVIDPNPSHRYPTYRDGVVPLLSTREFRGTDGWDASSGDVPCVPTSVYDEQNSRCRFSPRDIIMARKGRLGLARHSPPLPTYVFSHTLFVIKVSTEMDADYVLWFLRLNGVVKWLTREMNDNTGVPTLGKATTERLPLPIPPLEEQRRIVAKVDQLMKLCDDLEAKLQRAETTAAKLVEAVVAEMVA